MEAFFPDRAPDVSEIRQAKAVCARCEISEACREFAVRTHQVGIWGGTTGRDRKEIRRARRMGETGVEEAA
ncbi:WhiB family transcriptional regulator [Saccharopolyspora cebuensis]